MSAPVSGVALVHPRPGPPLTRGARGLQVPLLVPGGEACKENTGNAI